MPYENNVFDITIKRTGRVTNRIHALDEGETVWIRGPFGNTFPLELMEKSDLLIVAGGIGLAPLRPLIQYALHPDNRSKYGKIDMLLAARSSTDHCFTYDYDTWRSMGEATILQTIDREEPDWTGLVGFPHNLIKDMPIDIKNRYAILCGPPIMIKAVQEALTEMGMPPENIYTTLEMRMTCGVGKCAKCNIGHHYVCIDGPVFSIAELSVMPDEY
ncbi:MAG: FAD/NAD(P)-binding protein [Oscillospiraceae bacterium]|nr:FAD/NAD(P)-binding protein [Oscillospiraceae bacterium]